MAIGKTAGNKKKGNLRVRVLDGMVIKPCLYNGRALGHGQYMAAMGPDGNLVLDSETGKPFQFRAGALVDPTTLTV